MGNELQEYISIMSVALSAMISVGITVRIMITVINNMGDENAVMDGAVGTKVKRLIKALIIMLCITMITTFLYMRYFKPKKGQDVGSAIDISIEREEPWQI